MIGGFSRSHTILSSYEWVCLFATFVPRYTHNSVAMTNRTTSGVPALVRLPTDGWQRKRQHVVYNDIVAVESCSVAEGLGIRERKQSGKKGDGNETQRVDFHKETGKKGQSEIILYSETSNSYLRTMHMTYAVVMCTHRYVGIFNVCFGRDDNIVLATSSARPKRFEFSKIVLSLL